MFSARCHMNCGSPLMRQPNQYTMSRSADCSVFSDWLTDCPLISPDPPEKTCLEFQIDIYLCSALMCLDCTLIDPTFMGAGPMWLEFRWLDLHLDVQALQVSKCTLHFGG